MFVLLQVLTISVALYNRFRTLPTTLVDEWTEFLHASGIDEMKNTALHHHQAVHAFCSTRSEGCTWAEYHALVDHSREKWAHLFDALRMPAETLTRPDECVRMHRPTAEELLDLVRRQQPAVLTGLLDNWPALQSWADVRELRVRYGRTRVAVSLSDTHMFDHPEPAATWGISASDLQTIVARPAHAPMRLTEALAMVTQRPNKSLTAYIEYFPLEALASDRADAERLAHDLGVSAQESPSFGKAMWTRPTVDDPRAARVLLARGAEPGALRPARWLMPRKQLVWIGGGGTVGSTHFDPYENLMAVISGSKTFYLAKPEDGSRLGAHGMMAEGRLALERGEGGGEASWRLVRSAAAVSEALDLHHYARESLRSLHDSADSDSGSEIAVLRCSASAGEVLFTPSYWLHEVESHTDVGSEAPVVAVNWFYEPYYQRLFPNSSWDRSPHYALLDAQRPLEQPFPPRTMIAHPRRTGRRTRTFEDRLRERRAQDQPLSTQPSSATTSVANGDRPTEEAHGLSACRE